MIRAGIFRLSCVVIAFAALVVGRCDAQTTAKTLNGKDGVSISKITPRTFAEIPLPASDFVFYFELKAKMVTTPRGTLTIDFYRYSKQSLKVVRVAPTIRRSLAAGRGQKWLMTSGPINIASAGPDELLYVKAHLRNGRGKVVSWSESFNPLRGSVTMRADATKATVDLIKSLPGTTAPRTTLALDTEATFVIRLHYDVKSSPRGIISVEFGELKDIRQGTPWSVSVVEVPKGSGVVEIRRTFPISAAMKGATMTIGLALRTDPLGGATSWFELQPYPIGI